MLTLPPSMNYDCNEGYSDATLRLILLLYSDDGQKSKLVCAIDKAEDGQVAGGCEVLSYPTVISFGICMMCSWSPVN
jgi:hypothetical protein